MTVFNRRAYNSFIVSFILILILKQSKNIKIKIYRAINLPDVLYGNKVISCTERKTEAARSNTR